MIGLEFVEETTSKIVLIIKNLQTTHNRQKNCANDRRKGLEFETSDNVFLKVSLIKGIIRFGKKVN